MRGRFFPGTIRKRSPAMGNIYIEAGSSRCYWSYILQYMVRQKQRYTHVAVAIRKTFQRSLTAFVAMTVQTAVTASIGSRAYEKTIT
jgi:hypothetical protein